MRHTAADDGARASEPDPAHRLWRAAFGLAPARHLTVDGDTLAERVEQPVSNSTPWAQAPSVRVSARLRATGHHKRRGKLGRFRPAPAAEPLVDGER